MVRKVDRKLAKEGEARQDFSEMGDFYLGATAEKKLKETEENETSGGFVEAIKKRETREHEQRAMEKEENERRRIKLNDAAEVILSCLEPNSAQDIRMAAKDYKIHDMGIYMLGLVNRLVKTVDYYEPDIEAEWESGKVGYSATVKCKYCGNEVIEPKNIKQIYCSNRCAKRDRDFGKTGVIFPDTGSSGISDVEVEEKKWEQEQKRMGVI